MKKLLTMLLVLCMLLGLMAGCADKAEEPAENSAPAAEESAPVEETVPEEEAPEEPAVEAAPEEHDYTAQLPLCEERGTITGLATNVNLMGPLAELNITEYGQFDYWDTLTEMTNVDVDFKYFSFMAWSEQYNLFIAAGDYTDFVVGGDYTGGLLAGVEDEYIRDLSNVIQEYAPNYYNRVIDLGYEEKVKTDGYWLTINSFYDEYRENQGLLIRKDWLDALGLDIPQTWDEYYEVLLAFKTEYNPFKVIDINSECNMTNYGGFDFPYYSVAMGNLPYYQVDGVVRCSLVEDCYKEYLQTLKQYYDDGIIEKDFMTRSYDPMNSEFNGWIQSNNLGLWNASIEGISTVASLEKDEGFEIAPVIGPMENEGDVKQCSEISISDQSSTIITTGCDDDELELVMKWLDFWYTDEGVRLYNYGLEGIDHVVTENGVEFTEETVNNKYGLSLDQYLRCRTPFANLTGMSIRTRTASQYNDLQLYAWDMWTSVAVDGDRAIPSGATLGADEGAERSQIGADICTYADENIPQFIMGELNFEEDWDNFVQTCENMNIARCIELTQEAYDEYIGA